MRYFYLLLPKQNYRYCYSFNINFYVMFKAETGVVKKKIFNGFKRVFAINSEKQVQNTLPCIAAPI